MARIFNGCALWLVLLGSGLPATAETVKEPSVRVATLTYAGGKTSKCFAGGFLEDVARQTKVDLDRKFQTVALDSADVFQYPFVVLTGEGKFTLTDAEVHNLHVYLQRGGFLLASAGCSSHEWADSFRENIKRVTEAEPKPIALDHPIFHTLYDIAALASRKPGQKPVEVYGTEIDGRLAVVFSPYGLNDTGNAGGGCCCCGGDEVQNARLINADILTYALTH